MPFIEFCVATQETQDGVDSEDNETDLDLEEPSFMYIDQGDKASPISPRIGPLNRDEAQDNDDQDMATQNPPEL